MMTESQAVNDRPFYFSNLITDPMDTNILYKPGFSLNKSTDGGKTFSSAAVGRWKLSWGLPRNLYQQKG